MIKKFTFISLFIFWTVVVAVLTSGLVFYQGKKNCPNPQLGQNNLPSSVSITLNIAEISKHNSASDCWLLISGKVYNVTSYLYQHPGGAGTITPSCGTNATQAFDTKDLAPARSHSGFAASLLNDFYIGNLNQTVSGSATQVNPSIIPQRGFED